MQNNAKHILKNLTKLFWRFTFLVFVIAIAFSINYYIIIKSVNEIAKASEANLTIMKSVNDLEVLPKSKADEMIMYGEQIKNWLTDIKDERNNVILFYTAIFAILVVPLTVIMNNNKLEKGIKKFFLLFVFIAVIFIPIILLAHTYFMGGAFRRVNNTHNESQPLLVKFIHRAKEIDEENAFKNATFIASISPQIQYQSITYTETENYNQEKPTLEIFALSLNDPYFTDFFSTTQIDANTPYLLAQCFDLTFTPYLNMYFNKPAGYGYKINRAREDEDTYFNFIRPKEKYVLPNQDDRFNFLNRSIRYRMEVEDLFRPKDNASFDYYAPSDNRKEIANNHHAKGLDYFKYRSDWLNTMFEFEKAICWYNQTLRSQITENASPDNLKKTINAIIHLYSSEINALRDKPSLDNDRFIYIDIIVDAYKIYINNNF